MDRKKIKVVFVQRFMLHYRIDLLERISARENIELTLVHGRGIQGSKFVNYKGTVSFAHRQLKTIMYNRGGRGVVFFPSLFRQLRKLNPDVIVAEGESNILNNMIIYLYSVLFHKKIIWWGLGLIPGYSETRFQKMYRPFMLSFLKRSSYIIGYSEYSKSYYSQFADSRKIVVANNCLDNERIDREINECGEDSKMLRKRLKLEDRFIILYVGNFAATKRVDKLIHAYGQVKKNHPESALVIVAGGKDKEIYEEMVSKLGLEDVVFAGKVIEGVSAYFLMADLFVLPGLGGLSIHHAMVHGLPVIAAQADGTERDLIDEGVNGYILKTDTADELAERIEWFLADKPVAAQFGRKSREIVENRININNMVNTFVNAISGSMIKQGQSAEKELRIVPDEQ